MAEFMFEALKVAGLGVALLVVAGIAWATVIGLFRAVSGQHRRHQEALSQKWIDGWNAAMRGKEADIDEWARRMGDELDR